MGPGRNIFRNTAYLISVESESEEESVASDDKVEDPEKVSGTSASSTVTVALRCLPCPSFTLVVLPPQLIRSKTQYFGFVL